MRNLDSPIERFDLPQLIFLVINVKTRSNASIALSRALSQHGSARILSGTTISELKEIPRIGGHRVLRHFAALELRKRTL